MVLTRLSHVGEVCPLRDHCYSDPSFAANPSTSSRRIISVPKGSAGSPIVDNEVNHGSDLREIHILDLPTEILEKFFSYLTYKNISEIRIVCKRFDRACSNLLNMTFHRLQQRMLNCFQATKSQMPRRESARRKHPLARESDILETLHMRLSLLQMTFGKHIERKHCCFFPGEILDEVFRILRCVKSTPNMGKVFKITDELFDLSSMAMEYFKEHIEPSLPEISYFGSEFLEINKFSSDRISHSSGSCGRVSEPEEVDEDIPDRDSLPPSNMVLRKRIRKIRQGMKRYNSQLTLMTKQLKTCKGKISSQYKQIMEYVRRMEDYDKKVDETSRKLSTVLQELNKCKTELQYWRSKSPGHHVFCACGRMLGADGGSSGESLWTPKDFEDRPKAHSQTRFRLPSGSFPSVSISPSASVKNLEPLFDFDTFPSKPSTSPHSSTPINYSLKKEDTAELEDTFFKRPSVSDEEDTSVDTVGRRVKERKRIRIEPI